MPGRITPDVSETRGNVRVPPFPELAFPDDAEAPDDPPGRTLLRVSLRRLISCEASPAALFPVTLFPGVCFCFL